MADALAAERPIAAMADAGDVLRCAGLDPGALDAVLLRYGVTAIGIGSGAPIPGSFWGAPEAGLIGACLYLRPDTPVHSALHELSHFVCMSPRRRAALDTNAGGSDIEECAVCYLQLCLADECGGFGFNRALSDMDAWGYSFREGSARAWFAGDGTDARAWLETRQLLGADGRPTWRLRGE